LDDEALAGLADELDADDILFDQTFALSQVISENYDLPSGAAASELTLTVQADYSILYASASDLIELASLALNASLPSGFAPVSDAVTFESATDPQLDEEGTLRWTIRTEREIVQRLNPALVTQMIQGLSSVDAKSRLEQNLPLLSKPRISLSPSWWPWVPIVPFRIEVMTE
jgi:hypothetical protein